MCCSSLSLSVSLWLSYAFASHLHNVLFVRWFVLVSIHRPSERSSYFSTMCVLWISVNDSHCGIDYTIACLSMCPMCSLSPFRSAFCSRSLSTFLPPFLSDCGNKTPVCQLHVFKRPRINCSALFFRCIHLWQHKHLYK